MTTNISAAPRCVEAPTEGFPPHAPECLEVVASRWHEESKQRYEDMAHQLLELAEQRQRCA